MKEAAAATGSPLIAHQNHSLNLEAASSSSSTTATALQCLHFQSCSGCSQEWDLDRPHAVAEARRFFQELGVSDFSFENGRLLEWRCRAKLVVRGTSERPLVGLYEEGTHNVVDIPLCKAHHPAINSAVNLLKQGIYELMIQPYDEALGTGELRYIQRENSYLARAEPMGNYCGGGSTGLMGRASARVSPAASEHTK